MKRLKPLSVGWRSMTTPDLMDNRRLDLRPDAGRYEWGCPNFFTIFSIGAAVDYLDSIGIKRIEERVLRLTDYAIQMLDQKGFEVLSPREPKYRSGIVVFKASDAHSLWKKCRRRRIFISVRGQGIRLAPHFYNTFEEIDRLIKTVSS